METKKAATVKKLIDALQNLDPACAWYGWDDGSIIITEGQREILTIEPTEEEK